MIDLRSDTVTLPSPQMRAAIAGAVVGDDSYGDDPTVRELERVAASTLGKAAALFVPSGTMGNLLAHLAHCPGGAEVIAPSPSHTLYSEVGGFSRVAGMTVRTVAQSGGELDLNAFAGLVRPQAPSVLAQRTGLLWVEQPTRGYIVPIEHLSGLRHLADGYALPIHMDGARIFDAAVACGVPVAAIAARADSVMFCLSKSLGAPMGSLLVGSSELISRARVSRQMLGGGLRQAGIVAAAGLYALENNVERLGNDHDNARRLAAALAEMSGLEVDRETVETNMFFVFSDRSHRAISDWAIALKERGVLANTVSERGRPAVRFVTHLGITREDVDRAATIAADATGAWEQAGRDRAAI